MKLIRSLLCVPAHKPELYEKAARTDADCLMFDLEDSTPAQHKDAAFFALGDYLKRARHTLGKLVAVRINPDRKVEAAYFLNADTLDLLVVPKVHDYRDLMRYDTFSGPRLLPVIETPRAIMGLREILGIPSVVGGIFGIADFAAGMGVSDRLWFGTDRGGLAVNFRFLYAKQKLATYARAFGKQALDTCFIVKGAHAPAYVERAWREARGFGFSGAACIHPGQIESANRTFGPSAYEQEWAQRTHAEHAERSGEVGVDEHGMVVGLPVDRQARAIMARGTTR
jgi:citrate lyase beta subunit